MGTKDLSGYSTERRSEIRSEAERFYSVQFTTKGLGSFYQFKLWNLSANGMCILVGEESKVLNHLQQDDIIKMTYYPADAQKGYEALKTKIRHITKNENGRFQGHFLVGLSIL